MPKMPWPGVAYELLPEVAGGEPLPPSSHGGYRAPPPITSRVAGKPPNMGLAFEPP
jgi:hypothetical protein